MSNRGCFGISNESIDYMGEFPIRGANSWARPAIASGNCFLGYQAGKSIQVPQSTITAGSGAGAYNTFIGYQGGLNNTTGDSNTFIGYQAGLGNSTGSGNTFIGYQTGLGNSTGSGSTFQVVIGYQAIGGNYSVVVGTSASAGNYTECVVLGYAASVTNSYGVAIGPSASASSYGVSIGFSARTTSDGISIGYEAGLVSSGVGATFIGYTSGASNSTGVNTMIGYKSGYTATAANATTTGTRQTLIGYNTGANTATQLNDIVVIGDSATLGGSQSVVIGSAAGGAIEDVCIGYRAGNVDTGGYNVYIGCEAGAYATTGVNTMVGNNAGNTGALTGTQGAYATTTGTGQTLIGNTAGQNTASVLNYITCLGAGTQCGASGAVSIGVDHTGAGATTSTQDAIQLGTTNHTVNYAGSNTASGATVSSPTLGAAAQLAQTSRDAVAYLQILVAGQLTIAMGPTSALGHTIYTSTTVIGQLLTFRIPAGWYIGVTTTGSTTWVTNAITC